MTVQSNIEPYRILKIQDHIVPLEYLSGDTTMEQVVGGMWELRQRIRDPAKKYMQIMDGTGQPTMLNKRVEFEGGYAEDQSHKVMFRGWISKITPEFTEGGQTYVTIMARDSGLLLGRTPRNVTYGAKKNTKSKQPHRDGAVIESTDPADDRSWVAKLVVEQGHITLRQIFEGIINSYGYEPVYKGPEGIQFGGTNNTELHQKNETDLSFLIRIGRSPYYDEEKLTSDEAKSPKYDCQVFQDPENSSRWYFIERSRVSKSKISTISFYYPTEGQDQPYTIKPLSNVATLPMIGAPTLSIDGNKIAVVKPDSLIDPKTNSEEIVRKEMDDQGILTTYVLDKSKLNSPEAVAFSQKFDVATSSWDDVKQFWVIRKEEINPGEDEKSLGVGEGGRKFHSSYGWKLSFTTYGSIYIGIGVVYPVHNIDPYSGMWSAIKVTHTIGAGFKSALELTKES